MNEKTKNNALVPFFAFAVLLALPSAPALASNPEDALADVAERWLRGADTIDGARWRVYADELQEHPGFDSFSYAWRDYSDARRVAMRSLAADLAKDGADADALIEETAETIKTAHLVLEEAWRRWQEKAGSADAEDKADSPSPAAGDGVE